MAELVADLRDTLAGEAEKAQPRCVATARTKGTQVLRAARMVFLVAVLCTSVIVLVRTLPQKRGDASGSAKEYKNDPLFQPL